ncbi:MAG: hypothetical protein SWX82_10135 [Cyanobacteriota bacterium]|nr:hypothetical protein [Cyanobacteriota bacterium]
MGELHPLTLYYQIFLGDASSFLIRRGAFFGASQNVFPGIVFWGWRSPKYLC